MAQQGAQQAAQMARQAAQSALQGQLNQQRVQQTQLQQDLGRRRTRPGTRGEQARKSRKEEQGAAVLAEAEAAYNAHQWEASTAAYTRLTDIPEYSSEGFYGLGMTALAEGNQDSAQANFLIALGFDPRHANSLYQLGRLRENADTKGARDLYRQALASNPGHASARARLQALGGLDTTEPARLQVVGEGAFHLRAPEALDTVGGIEERGVYDLLRQDQSEYSRAAVRLIESLNMSRHLRIRAHLLRLIFCGLFPPVIGALLKVIRVRSWRVTITNGRVYCVSGVFKKTESVVDLWLVTDVFLKRTFVNRLTGDGTITLVQARNGSLTLRGLARYRELEKIFQKLQDLKFTLRVNPLFKGIIQ
jgi:hypothetical protein